MTITDQYGLELSTDSTAAADAYIEGLERAMRIDPTASACFVAALEHDPDFALALVAVSFQQQFESDPTVTVRLALTAAQDARTATRRERQHVAVLRQAAARNWVEVARLARAHLDEFPRDVLVLWQLVRLLGYGGQPDRKAQAAALLDGLAPHYGDDVWFTANYGLILSETGQLAAAERVIGRVLAIDPHHPLAAHSRVHLTFERGDDLNGRGFLAGWLADNDGGLARPHLRWHLATSEIAIGNPDRALELFRSSLESGADPMHYPESLLWRLRLRGVDVTDDMAAVAETRQPPSAGINATFELANMALVFAAVGDVGALDELRRRRVQHATEQATAVFTALVDALRFVADGRWAEAVPYLETVCAEVQVLGGSNEQHLLFHETLAFALGREDVLAASP